MSDTLWWSQSDEVQPDLTPESFERDLDKQVEGLDLDDLFLDLFSTPLVPTHHDPTASLTSRSESTLTTNSNEDPAPSEYSSTAYSTSNYPPPLDIAGSEYGVDHKNIFFDPAVFFESPQLSPAEVHVFKVQSDDELYQPSAGVAPHTLSMAFPPAVPTDPPACAASVQQARKSPNPDAGDTQRRTGPIRTKHTCPHCGHVSNRKHNLKTHMDTHDPNRVRPYVCPESDCGHLFTRKHDCQRHMEAIHGK